jgi:hypothetical protein
MPEFNSALTPSPFLDSAVMARKLKAKEVGDESHSVSSRTAANV